MMCRRMHRAPTSLVRCGLPPDKPHAQHTLWFVSLKLGSDCAVLAAIGCGTEVRLEQSNREVAAFRARSQKVTAELTQLKIDHADALATGVTQRDGDGWEMNEKRSRFCAIM